ncbi:MAG: enterochelin esterase [Betaproteobacteria bacterium]|nr:enterochelin esterase [Betaproteobacteria bacterium]
MALKHPRWSAGRTVFLEHTSRVLADNPLKDPATRPLAVWLPPQYDAPAYKNKRFPVLVDLVGFMGSGLAHVAWRNFDENVPERAARLIHEKKMGPAIFVFPDCFTALGGNQYVNSSAIGRYADYLVDEILPFVDREFRTLAAREHRACFGKSSGGYGAMLHGMKYAKHWGAIANHSGDAYFDFLYFTDWPRTLNELAKYRARKRKPGPIDVRREEKGATLGQDDGRARAFLESVWRKDKLTEGEGHALMNLAMAATYDPDPKAPLGFRLPCNLETGELIPERHKAWLRHDPIHLVDKYRGNLATLRAIYIDCGWRDQYHIHYGTRILSKRLHAAGIVHRYEEFDDNHSGIDYRMNTSLPFLYKAIQP